MKQNDCSQLKKECEFLSKENSRLRDNLRETEQAYTRTVCKVNSLQLKVENLRKENEKLKQEKNELAQQLVGGSDTVYIKNCDNLTFNL